MVPASPTSRPLHHVFSPKPIIGGLSLQQPVCVKTVSAAQALQDLRASPTRCVSTGLKDLDAALQNRDPATILDGDTFYGGVTKGTVTEIYGPPGVGKTALGYERVDIWS